MPSFQKILICTSLQTGKFESQIYENMKELVKKYFCNQELINSPLFENIKEHEVLEFLNCHILRASICRIVGLIRLLNMDEVSEEEKVIIAGKLENEVDNFEESVKELRKISNLGDLTDKLA